LHASWRKGIWRLPFLLPFREKLLLRSRWQAFNTAWKWLSKGKWLFNKTGSSGVPGAPFHSWRAKRALRDQKSTQVERTFELIKHEA
jgi:hypothetical protein